MLKKLAPKMPLHIDEDYTHNLRTKLRNGELDVIFVALPFEEPEVDVIPLYEEEFIALLPEKHPWVKRDKLHIVDIADEVMIMLGAGHCFRDQVIEACPQCKDSSLNPQKDWITGSSIETIRQMVASGLGISVIPRSAANFHNEKLGLVTREFDKPIPSRKVALAFRRSFPRKKALEIINNALSQITIEGAKPLD